MEETTRRVDEYDEDGVRKPDPVKVQRLISGGSGGPYTSMGGAWFRGGPNAAYVGGSLGGGGDGGGGVGSSSGGGSGGGGGGVRDRIMSTMEEAHFARGRAEDPSVEWLFPPPADLSHPGPLDHVSDTWSTLPQHHHHSRSSCCLCIFTSMAAC